jgi:LacI family transcriptional regulator
MATIQDVAKKAQVSIKTVSRVMNRYEHISERTRKRVEAAMAELNYAPSAIARQMRMGDSLSIGVLLADPSSGYQSQLNHSLLKACSKAHRYLAVELFDEDNPDWAGQVAQFLDRSRVANMILVPPICDAIAVHDLLRARGVRFVLVSPSRPVAGASAVAMDDRLAAREVTDHLIALGHRRIAHIMGRDEHIVTVLRRLGYQDAIQAAGLVQACEGLVVKGNFAFREALTGAEALLAGPNPPTAIFAANDTMAVAVMMSAHKMGLRVPDDLSVAGFDDTPMGRAIWPPLTTVAQPFDALSQTAVGLLSDPQRAPDSASQIHILPHTLFTRGSTSPAPSTPH